MTNKTFLIWLLRNDSRKELIMALIVRSFMGTKFNPLDMELTSTYRVSWLMFLPRILADSTNNEHHVSHSICHDLTNIQYDFKRNKHD